MDDVEVAVIIFNAAVLRKHGWMLKFHLERDLSCTRSFAPDIHDSRAFTTSTYWNPVVQKSLGRKNATAERYFELCLKMALACWSNHCSL